VNGPDKLPVRVLMVDDDLVDRRAVRRALGASYVVTEAENENEVRQSFACDPPDCVLLDYNIPGTDTLALLDRLRQHVPVVMLTGRNDVGTAVAAMKAGAQDYLSKDDFSAERLDRAIQRSIDKADRQRRENEARERLRTEYRSEKRRREELEAALQVARDIQQNLLPTRPPSIEGFDVCGVCLPIEETAGDFYDYFAMGDGSLAIVVGDVCGHGIGPALLTAETRAYLRALARTHSDVGQMATIVNRLLCDDVGSGRFLTIFLGRFDPAEQTLTYATAGHPAFVVRPNGHFQVLDSQIPPLGMFEDLIVPTSAPVRLSDEEILFVATDGLFDTTAPDGSLLGIDTCLRLIATECRCPAEKIVDELLHAAQSFADGRPHHDDLTILIGKA
jgi:phosphoserine phosphatase RsbU/P